MAHTYLGRLVPMVLRMVVAAALMVGVTTVFLREWETQGPSMLATQKDIRDNDDAVVPTPGDLTPIVWSPRKD